MVAWAVDAKLQLAFDAPVTQAMVRTVPCHGGEIIRDGPNCAHGRRTCAARNGEVAVGADRAGPRGRTVRGDSRVTPRASAVDAVGQGSELGGNEDDGRERPERMARGSIPLRGRRTRLGVGSLLDRPRLRGRLGRAQLLDPLRSCMAWSV